MSSRCAFVFKVLLDCGPCLRSHWAGPSGFHFYPSQVPCWLNGPLCSIHEWLHQFLSGPFIVSSGTECGLHWGFLLEVATCGFPWLKGTGSTCIISASPSVIPDSLEHLPLFAFVVLMADEFEEKYKWLKLSLFIYSFLLRKGGSQIHSTSGLFPLASSRDIWQYWP